MSERTQLIYSAIRDITYILDYLDVPSICIGGAARDLYYGKEPKGIDVIVLQSPVSQTAELEPYYLEERLIKRGIPAVVYTSYDGSACSDYLDWVIKCKVWGIDVDIIKHTDTPSDEQDAMSRMECSLNAICVNPPVNGGLQEFILHSLHPALNEGRVTWLNPRGPEVDKWRLEYLSSKYPELEWPDLDVMYEVRAIRG